MKLPGLRPVPFSAPVVLLFAALLLLLPLLLRVFAGNPLIPGPGSYSFLSSGATSLVGGPTVYSLFLEPLGETRILTSILLGLLAAYLFHRLATVLFPRPDEQAIALLLFLINPLFLSIFAGLSPYALAVPAALLCLVFFYTGRFLPVPFLVALVASLSPLFAALLLVLLILRHLPRRFAVVSLLLAFPASLLAAQPQLGLVDAKALIAEFGAPLGFSLIYVAFALIGGVVQWGQRRDRAPFLLFAALLLLAPFVEAARIAVGLFAIPFAARFLSFLIRRRWRLRAAADVTLLLTGCLLLFLLISHAIVIASEEPTKRLVGTLAALPPDSGVVLGPPELSPIIGALTTHSAYVEPGCGAAACGDVARLYASRRLGEAEPILRRLDIRYLLITKEMRQGLVWNRDEEGLLFLLKHSDRFSLLASDGEQEIWRYTP
jgi:hypothetical protein